PPHLSFFPFTPPSPTDIYPLSLHDALPIWFTSRGLPPRGTVPSAQSREARAQITFFCVLLHLWRGTDIPVHSCPGYFYQRGRSYAPSGLFPRTRSGHFVPRRMFGASVDGTSECF